VDNLTKDDFVRNSKRTKDALNASIRHYLEAEEVNVSFADDAIEEIAQTAFDINASLKTLASQASHRDEQIAE